MMSGLLVAPMMNTFFLLPIPSICQDLVDHPVGSATSITTTAASGLGNGVQLVEEEDARCSAPGLVEHVPHVGLGLSEPHSEQLRALDGDEVGLALVGDGLGEQGLTTTRRSVEEDTSAGHHAELQELLWVLDWVLHQLLQLPLDVLEATNIGPGNGGHLDDALSGGRRCALAHGVAEVSHSDSKAVKYFSVNGLVLEIDQVHLLPDLLQSCFTA